MPQTGNATCSAEEIDAIVSRHFDREGPLLPILHDVQATWGHIPDAAVPLIARALNLSRADVWGVVTFYHDLRTEPAGKHVLKICRAEACQAMGCEELVERAEQRLGVTCGQTSANGRVTLEAVYCLGLCATAPSAMLDGKVVGRLDEARLEALIKGAGA